MVRCCAGDEGWPLGVALQGEASNHLELRWLKTVVVSVRGKGARDASGGVREGERKRTAVEASKQIDGIETGATLRSRDGSGGCLLTGQVVSGV